MPLSMTKEHGCKHKVIKVRCTGIRDNFDSKVTCKATIICLFSSTKRNKFNTGHFVSLHSVEEKNKHFIFYVHLLNKNITGLIVRSV